MGIISHLISLCIQILVGWILIQKVPNWLNIKGLFATVVKIIGVLIIIRAIISWF